MRRITPEIEPTRGGRLDRRQFIKSLTIGASGAAFAGATGLSPVRALAADAPLTYAFWPFGDQIIADDARIFKEQYGQTVNLQPIPGRLQPRRSKRSFPRISRSTYFVRSGARRRGGSRPNGSARSTTCPRLDIIQKEEFPGIGADALSWPDHKRIGLTYYNGGPYCMFRNEKVLAAGGYEATANRADYPQTWDEIYKQAVDLKKKGHRGKSDPSAWIKSWTGTPWALYAHCDSEGETLVDDDMKATFSLDTPMLGCCPTGSVGGTRNSCRAPS